MNSNTLSERNAVSHARVAGLLYLIIAIVGPFSILYIPSTLVAAGDAAATANNIMASESLFRLGFVGDTIVFLSEVVLVGLLYILFRPVNRTLSLVAAFARLAMAIVQGINLLNYFYVLLLVSGAGYLSVFEPGQLHALMLMFLNAHEYGVYIWETFFALHCFVLGYLLFKSGYFPRILGTVLGVLLVVNGLGYLLDSLGSFLVADFNPTISMIFILPGSIGELVLTFWLLIKGVNIQSQEHPTGMAANFE